MTRYKNALLEYVNNNNKKDFNLLVQQFKNLYPERTETIEKNKINNLKINANKIIFPVNTKTNKSFNIFYNTGFETFDYIQKEETSFI